MINKTARTLETQLNGWIVARFIEEIYNRNSLRHLPELVARHCRFYHESSEISKSLDELQLHFTYTSINQQAIFERVDYRIDKILSRHDIVSVRIHRYAKVKSHVHIKPELFRWEMFQLHEGKIIQRWIANI